jgi:hypothetical protein
MAHKPRLGIQGPVVSFQDPWAGEASDRIMRTGTGSICPSQDPRPEPEAYVKVLQELQADFYVHHVIPEMKGDSQLLADLKQAGLDVCLGNEYGNINGPWTEGTNRYDVPDEELLETLRTGVCIGLLYDEPEHLQINAAQYRKDGWFPHWGITDGLSLEQSREQVELAVRDQVSRVSKALKLAGAEAHSVPLISEQVFPTMFHTLARAGMDLCPKIMKESFQSLQLSTALGAAKQYNRKMWICADLWGPDTGRWFTRFQGFPGHSPEEFASALRMGYLMGPSHLFVENIDVLLRHHAEGFEMTEYGEVWQEFTKAFVPQHPLEWHHSQAEPDIAIIHSDDSNYGQNERLFGNRTLTADHGSQSVFHMWHLVSRGAIPAHGSCMHIPGFEFPRHELKQNVPVEQFPLVEGYESASGNRIHPLFYPVHNVLVYDDQVTAEQLGRPKLTLVGGSSLSSETLQAVVRRAEEGGTVIIAKWLLPTDGPAHLSSSRRLGQGKWIVTDSFLHDAALEAAGPLLGDRACWMQRFGSTEIRMYAKDQDGYTLDFEIAAV